MAVCAWRNGDLDFGVDSAGLPLGFARAAWGFTLGAVLYRWRGLAPSTSFITIAFMLLAALSFPRRGPWNGAFDLLAARGLLPALVLAGSVVRLDGFAKVAADFVGRISYPLYITHYPIIRIVGFATKKLSHAGAVSWSLAFVGTLAAVALAIAADRWFDRTVRARLGATHAIRRPSAIGI